MEIFFKNIKETVESLNLMIKDNVFVATTKKVKRYLNIKPGDNSKTNFVWRTLDLLEKTGFLEKTDGDNPKTYKIKLKNIDWEQTVQKVRKFLAENKKIR